MSPQNHVGDDAPQHEDPSALRRSDRAAADRAEAIARAREEPHTPTPEQLVRPGTVLIGCGMTWVGLSALFYEAVVVLRADAIEGVKAADLDEQLAILHGLGEIWIFWGVLLLLFSVAAYTGRRWGATALVVMAGLVVLGALVSVLSAFAVQGVLTAIWSVSAASLVRYREPSKDWYNNLRQIREATK